jgi:hypothetical protein
MLLRKHLGNNDDVRSFSLLTSATSVPTATFRTWAASTLWHFTGVSIT